MYDSQQPRRAAIILLVCLLLFWQAVFFESTPSTLQANNGTVESWCPIPEHMPVLDHGHGLRPSSDFSTDGAIEIQVERLSSAVRVPTESWDDNGDVDVDPRWKAFEEFHKVLSALFPKVYGSTEPHVLYGLYSSRPLVIILLISRSHIVTASSTH